MCAAIIIITMINTEPEIRFILFAFCVYCEPKGRAERKSRKEEPKGRAERKSRKEEQKGRASQVTCRKVAGRIQPISVLRFWISEGLTRAES